MMETVAVLVLTQVGEEQRSGEECEMMGYSGGAGASTSR